MTFIAKIFSHKVKPECDKRFTAIELALKNLNTAREESEKDIILLKSNFQDILKRLDDIKRDVKFLRNGKK
jgi:hypothetical protein